MNTSPKFYVVSDRHAGLVQWLGEAYSAEHALELFWDVLSGSDRPTSDGFRVVEITAAQVPAVESWSDAGHPAEDCPDFL